MAKNNELVDQPGYDQSPRAIRYRQGLVDRLTVYENTFEEHFEEYPDATENQAHRAAKYASGLLDAGLTTARSYAGKKPSSKPGVFRLESEYESE